jgi:hypothetical protein
MQSIINEFPCLTEIFSKIDQKKTMAFLKYSEGYYDSPDEMFLFDLWEEVHKKLDDDLHQDISMWDRYIMHDQLDYLLNLNHLLFDAGFEGRYMFDFHNYPPEEDGDELYEQLQQISPFRNLPPEPMIQADELLK